MLCNKIYRVTFFMRKVYLKLSSRNGFKIYINIFFEILAVNRHSEITQ